MPPIYIMAAITLALGVLLYGSGLYALSGRQTRYLWLLPLGLPLSALANLVIKAPLARWVGQAAGIQPGQALATPLWFVLFLMLLPPVVEEAIKVLPLLLPPVRRMVDGRAGALWVGMALGIGLGLGEALSLAYGVAQAPQYAGYPWYAFTGYLWERLAVCFAHGVMAAVVVTGLWVGGRQAVRAYLSAVLWHLLLNLGAVLAQFGLLPPWMAGLSLVAVLVLLVWAFERMRRAAIEAGDGDETVYYRRGQ